MAPLQLTIKTLQQKHFKLDVDSEDTILSVKEKIQESQGHAIATQKLIFSGKILADDKKVDDYKISEKDFLVVMVSKPKVTPAASSSAAATPKESTPVVKAAEPAAATVPESAAAVPAAATIETAAAAAAAAAAEPAPASTTNEDSGSQLVTGTQLDSVIQNMMEMGFERDQCVRALRASFNNPDRAVEYLFNGIPQNILDEMNANQQAQQAAASQQQAEAGTAPATAAAQPTSPSATTETNPNAPLNLFAAAQQQAQQAAQQQQQQSAGANPDFANLRNTAHFQQIRQLVQSNPALLQPLLQQLGQSNPELLRSINADPNGFLQALLEGVDDEGLEGGQGGQVPPGSQMVQVTQEEKEAIDRLVALGFDRHIVIEAYFACEKNEELAANYLFEHGNEEYED